MRPFAAVLCVLTALTFTAGLPGRAGAQERVVVEPRFEHDARFVRVGNTTHGVRFKTASGEAWLLAIDKWQKIAEDGKLPAGDYEVFLVGGENDFSAYRFDHKTGATWTLSPTDLKWVRVAAK
ncbi:MAG: hypothetical protein AB7K24_17075 [Gemmataceae bacterium]